jgi:hypothetical protein
LITAKGRVIYQYENSGGSWMGYTFSLQDVLGDGVPQIIFQTGVSSATGGLFHVHVIRLTLPTRIVDVASPDFETSEIQDFDWFAAQGKTFGIVAVPQQDESAPCHICAHAYEYQAYLWNPRRERFEIVAKFPGTAAAKADEFQSPLVTDHDYIEGHLASVRRH